MSSVNKAVFLDRDDTLMKNVPYCRDPDLVEPLPGVRDGLLRLQQAGFLLFIISNQSGIARGLCTDREVQAVNARLEKLLHPAIFTGIYYSPDAPGTPSTTRKPAPGLILAAARKHNIHLPSSWMLGDQPSDIAAGRAAGCRTIWIPRHTADQSDIRADHRADDFTHAVEIILRESTASNAMPNHT